MTNAGRVDRVVIPKLVADFHAAVNAGNRDAGLAKLEALTALGAAHPKFGRELRDLARELRRHLPVALQGDPEATPRRTNRSSKPASRASSHRPETPDVLAGVITRSKRGFTPAKTPEARKGPVIYGGGLPSLGTRR